MHRTARTLCLLALLSAACTTAGAARRAGLRRALDEARVSRSPAEIWPELQRFVHERGYPLVGDDRLAVGLAAQGKIGKLLSPGHETRVLGDGGRILETSLDERSRSRIRAEARVAADGGAQLRITVLKQSESNPTDYSEWRDEELELALLRRLDPAAAARVLGTEAGPAPAGPASRDGWAAVRRLVGSWAGALPGSGAPVRWRFDFVAAGQFIEMRGSPLLFAGPAARTEAAEEMGRISRDPAGDKLEWHHFTAGGRVDRYETEAISPEALVFLARAPESLPAGARARLTLGRSGDEEMLATLELAEPGKDLALAGEVRLRRAR
ncbi:MAG TPA: hypothetical protein VIW03_05180 [Anaeromyxobacter sp.]